MNHIEKKLVKTKCPCLQLPQGLIIVHIQHFFDGKNCPISSRMHVPNPKFSNTNQYCINANIFLKIRSILFVVIDNVFHSNPF